MPRSAVDRLFDRWRRTGDPAALAEVFDRTASELFGIALHMARDAHEAEDLVQATYLAAIEDAARWDAQRPFLPWLSGILANRARRLRQQRRPRHWQPPGPDAVGEPLQAALANETLEQLEKALDKLPESYRPVLVLSLVYGHDPAEIAHALRRSPGTVRSQLSRGREMLRRHLPRGLVAGAVLGVAAWHGLAAVRQVVLAKASVAVPPAAAGAGVLGALWIYRVPACLGVVVAALLSWAWLARA